MANVNIDIQGFGNLEITEQIVMTNKNIKADNLAVHKNVIPRKMVTFSCKGNHLVGHVEPYSWNMLRIKVVPDNE